LYSGDRGKSIKDCESPAVIGKLFTSEDEAMLAAQQSKRALLYWSIKQRVGIDFGDGKQRSIVTKAGLSYFEKQWGCPVRNDIHGIDIYEHVEELRFVRSSAKPRVGKHLPRLVDTFQHEFAGKRHFTEKQLLASEIYASSFFDVSPRSRFITLITAVEALSERVKRSDNIDALVEELKAKAKKVILDDDTRNSIMGRLGDLKYQSIGEAGRTLVGRLLPAELHNRCSSVDFFTKSYNLRSDILHLGTIPDKKVDVLDLANKMEEFVHRLLIASLNNE